MNGEKSTAALESKNRFQETVREPALELQHIYESQAAIVEAAKEALSAEGVFEENQDLFIEAESIDSSLTAVLGELLSSEVAYSFTDFHTDALERAKKDLERYKTITQKLIVLLDERGYEVAVNNEVLPPQAEEAEVVVSNPTTPEPPALVQVETKSVSEPLAAEEAKAGTVEQPPTSLADLYRFADQTVLRTYSAEKGKDVFKKLEVIVGEIKSALTESRFEQSRIDLFMREVVGNICFDIKTLNQQKAAEVDKNKKNEFNRHIKAKYKELLDAVAGFMQTEKVDELEGFTAEALPQMSHEDVDEQLRTLREKYDELKERISDGELVTRIEALLDVVDRYSETDVTRQILDKTKYIEKLETYLAEAAGKLSDAETTETSTTEAFLQNEGAAATFDQPAPEKKHAVHFEIKANYKAKEKAYKEAMEAYYQDDSLRARLRSGAASAKALLGFKAELPEHLELLHREYKALRAQYAESLDLELSDRSSRAGNKEYDSTSNTTKAAFGTKFILKPGQEFLALQERSLLTPEQQAKVQSALRLLAKHKWTTRAGLVALAGAAGAVSGGATMALAGAGVQAGKIGVSMAAGSGAGFLTKEGFQGSVDAAARAAGEARENAVNNFSLTDLDTLEAALVSTERQKEIAEKRQKVATVGAGVLAGGYAGFEMSAVANTESTIAYKNTPTVETIVTPPVEVAAESTTAPALSEEAIARQVAAEKASMAEAPAVEWKLNEITVPYEGLDNTKLSYETVLSDVKVVGAITDTTLSQTERSEVDAFLKLKTHDLLSAHPNISESKLEAELFEKLQGKFAGAPWWSEAKITAVDIGGVVVRPVAAVAEAAASEAPAPLEVIEEPVAEGTKITINDERTYTESAQSPERVSDIYTVQKGDTLYGIAAEQFATKLAHLSPIERGELLDKLFSRVEEYPELQDSLGLKSGDIDVIYPEEKINLSGLEAELAVLLERREIIEQFKNSAPLSVEADSEVKNIPITVVEKPVAGGVAIETSGQTYTEAAPSTQTTATTVPTEVVPPPRPFALNGQYADQPAYKEYIQSVFGSARAYEQAVERAVQNFDNSTYDVFERASFFGGNTYESPYRLLGEMSLAEVTEFEKQPNSEIRSFLSENNIKYDTYLAWLDKIDEMIKVLPYQAETKVSDLFARYVVEIETPKGNTLIT